MKVDVTGKRVYLSGPMTGKEHYNQSLFRVTEGKLYEMGAAFVFNPCEHWRDKHGQLPNLTHDQYMMLDLRGLLVAEPFERDATDGVRVTRPWFDMLVSLPGWEKSEGASLERAVAEACGIECADWSEV